MLFFSYGDVEKLFRKVVDSVNIGIYMYFGKHYLITLIKILITNYNYCYKRGAIMMVKIKNLMKIRKFSLLCLFLSVPCSFIGSVLRVSLLGIAGISLLIIFLDMTLIFWRCPYCKKALPIKFNINEDIDDNYNCPYCNGKF